MDYRLFVTPGLGDNSYLLVSGGEAAVIDPQRDAWRFLAAAVHLGDLPARLGELPRDREMWTACASGYRASIGASLLDRAGVPVRLLSKGGVPEWLARCHPRAGTA